MSTPERPSPVLAIKVLSEVRFEDRLEGYSLRERAGAVRITMYSLKEVASFLNGRHPRIDFQTLQGWVRDVIGDRELADLLKEVDGEPISGQAKCDRCRQLIQRRLGECEEVV